MNSGIGTSYGSGGLGRFRPPRTTRMPRAPQGYQASRVAGFLANQPDQVPLGEQNNTQAYDFSQDPALQRILAADAAAKSNAQAAALAAEKQLAIQLGDAKGIIGDAATAKEAANNPYSTLASLAKGYRQTQVNTDESANKTNLFYSGARAKQLGLDADNYQHQQYDARNAAMNALATIQANLAAAESGYSQADAAGYQNAAGNAQQQALTYGYDPGAAPKASITGALAQKPQNSNARYAQGLAVSPAFRLFQQGRMFRTPGIGG